MAPPPPPVSSPLSPPQDKPGAFSNLTLRIGSAVVLMPLAVGAAWYGGWPFTAFWAAAAIAVLWEWLRLVRGPVWMVAGVFYAAVMVVAPVWLRADPQYGALAIVVLFAIVWSTDIFGFFFGRAIGGPKLLPSVSPKKTWSGAIAGTVGAMIVAVAAAGLIGSVNLLAVAGVALLLSVCAQAGDLFESFVKRRFGAKDSSQLIPGHGGVMDRLDGFWAAALAGCLIGALHGGAGGVARGLLVW